MSNLKEMRLDTKKQRNNIAFSFKNDLVFGHVMGKEHIMREFLSDFIPGTIEKIEYREQYTISNLSKKLVSSVRLDLIVTTDNQVIDIELHRSVGEDIPRRARYYSSMLDKEYSSAVGVDKYNIKDSYVIFLISSWDVPYADYTMRDVSGNILNDGRHIIFIDYKKFSESIEAKYMPNVSDVCNLLADKEATGSTGKAILEEMESVNDNNDWRNVVMTYEERVKAIAHEEAKDLVVDAVLSVISEKKVVDNIRLEILQEVCERLGQPFEYVKKKYEERIK